jgi:hypothetical protein
MLPPLFRFMHLLSLAVTPKVSKNSGVRNQLFIMPILTLSAGFSLLSERVEWAEYYPSGSLRRSALLNGVMAGHVGVSARQEQDLLYIRTANGVEHVRRGDATQDITVLEKAGVQVHRSPKVTALRNS